ncbi:MAG: penicillin-binding protein 2, partial [Acidobacteria bacterium]|nr:penicillin-binding protein 2 [Acidobacteriota bacterium]
MSDPGSNPAAKRIWILLGAGCVWIIILIARLADLQLHRSEEFAVKAKRQQERTIELPPRRGAILDRTGEPLAITASVDSVFAIPSEMDGPEPTAKVLSDILGVPHAEVLRKLSDRERDFVWIARRVQEDLADRVSARKLKGVRLIKESIRRYPQSELASSVLGYVGLDNQGLSGIEFRFDRAIRGRPARVTVLRDAAQRYYAAPGRPLRLERDGGAVEGAALSLTLDASIQHIAEKELMEAFQTYRARAGSVVVMDPYSGEILALASAPVFDPNRYGEFDPEFRKCRAIADVYEPGSTFKAFTVAAGLETGVIEEGDVIDCGGGALTIGSTTIHEHGRSRYGALPVGDVLAFSSNIGSARIGMSVGRTGFFKVLRNLGFGKKTGIEIEGETAGLLRDVRSWSALTLPTMSFGQEIGVTLLQMARGYSAIANGGMLVGPHLISEVRYPDGRVEKMRRPAAERVLSEKTAETLRRLLQLVVSKGTGKRAAVPGFTVAGKTGTAQKAVPGGGYSRDRFVASFIGFVPADTPRVVIAVEVDEPKGKQYGGDVAAPVFSAVASQVMQLLHEAPHPDESRTTPTTLVAELSRSAPVLSPILTSDLVPASTRFRRPSHGLSGDGFPDLSGQSARDATR